MIALFLLIIFGLGTAYFATQNTGTVGVMLAGYPVDGVPLYLIVIISMLFGILVSWVISLIDSFSSVLTIHSKDSEINKSQKVIHDLEKQNHDLEIENAQLKGENKITEHRVQDEKEHAESLKPSFFQKIKHGFA